MLVVQYKKKNLLFPFLFQNVWTFLTRRACHGAAGNDAVVRDRATTFTTQIREGDLVAATCHAWSMRIGRAIATGYAAKCSRAHDNILNT
jgi:hypothetical protein